MSFSKKKKKSPPPKTQREREELAVLKAKRRAERRDPNSRLNIAMPYIFIIFALFTGLCLYTESSGSLLGAGVRTLFFGLFSYLAYLMPFLLILLGLFWRRWLEKRVLLRQVLLASFATLIVLSLLYTLTLPPEVMSEEVPRSEVRLNGGSYFSLDNPAPRGGGFIGALIGWLLYRLAGPAGSILIAALAVLLYGIFGFGLNPDAILTAAVKRFRALLEARRAAKAEAERAARVAPAAPVTEEAASEAPSEKSDSRHKRFSRFFGDEPSKREEKAAPAAAETAAESETEAVTAPAPTPEEAEETRRATIISNLKKRHGVTSYTVADFLKHQEAATAAYHEEQASPVHRAAVGSDTSIPVLKGGEEIPFRELEDFRRVTVTSSPAGHAPSAPASMAYTPSAASAAFSEGGARAPFDTAAPTHATSAAFSAEPPVARVVFDPTKEVPDTEQEETEEKLMKKPLAESVFFRDTLTEAEKTPTMAEATWPSSSAGAAIPSAGGSRSAKKPEAPEKKPYVYPPINLLRIPSLSGEEVATEEIQKNADILVKTLESFGIPITITGYARGPRITRYEFVQKDGIRVGKIVGLANDITQKLSKQGVRIEAPIPNKSSIGVEVPNEKASNVYIRSLLDTDTFRNAESKSTVAMGCDVTGRPIFFDLSRAPHMLIAGATGMGKSVCINSILISLLYKASPDEVRLILIDPKKVEFNVYANIPHLLVPVVTDPEKAAGALSWAVNEMEERYNLIEEAGVRNITGYNKVCESRGEAKLPTIIIVIDELNDLMMSARKTVESSICRIAQKARAAGIHLLIGTQRPSVQVITGDIKVNIPARCAFRVNRHEDSRTILDMMGAEKLLPNGDMLFSPAGTPQRVQGAYVDDDEVRSVVAFIRQSSGEAQYDDRILSEMEREAAKCSQKGDESDGPVDMDGVLSDPAFEQAVEVAFASGGISTSLLQRKLHIGFGKAASYIDAMVELGIVGESGGGARPRPLLMSKEEFLEREERRKRY